MDIKSMHYDLKKKVNKVDSQKYRNLRIPEIDWTLNEAAELFVKIVSMPRLRNHLGFETSQRSIDDIRTIVKTKETVSVTNNIVPIPTDYKYFVEADVLMTKGKCKDIKGDLLIRQHEDNYENSPFDKSSFKWREVNGVFNEDGIRLDTQDFTVSTALLSYIKEMPYMHNAGDFGTSGTYNLPSGTPLTGTQDCVLPEHTHREIVDIAVLIITGELQIPDYQIKQAKLNMNKLA